MQFKHLIWNLSKTDIDLVNILVNIVEKYEQFNVGHTFDYKSPFYSLEVNLHDLAASLGYLSLNEQVINSVISTLDNLTKIQAAIYYKDNNDRSVENTTFIFNYVMSSIHRDLNKRLSITLSTSLIKVLREYKKLFFKLYTYARYDLRGKYSIMLYDELSRKAKPSVTSTITYTLPELIELVDFELTINTNLSTWAKINGNILTRAAKEINEKSILRLNYEKVKEKLKDVNRTQTNSVSFNISLAPELEPTDEYFTEDILVDRKVKYYMEKVIDKKVNQLMKFGSLKNRNEEDNYRFKTRQDLQKMRDEFEAQVFIQEWVNWVKYNNPGEHGLVTLFDYNKYQYVTITSNYKLMDVESNKILSENAKDTRIKIQNFINNDDGDYGLIEIDYKKEYSISYTKG